MLSLFSSFPQSVLNVISELQEQMCRLQLDIHRQIQERLLLARDHPEEVVADDHEAKPQPCSQDCAPWEGSPVGAILKYTRACVCVCDISLVEAGVSPNQNGVQWLCMDLLLPQGRTWPYTSLC